MMYMSKKILHYSIDMHYSAENSAKLFFNQQLGCQMSYVAEMSSPLLMDFITEALK